MRSLLACLALLLGMTAHAADPAAGQRLYAPCAACHGAQAEGAAATHAPRLAGREEWYLAKQLAAFRSGARGADPADIYGAQMARAALVLWDNREAADVAAYVASLPASASPATLRGDAARGETLYAACAACHGAAADGSQALGAPALAGLDDWYVRDQLALFRAGRRGGGADPVGQVMQPLAAALPDEQALSDIAAYVQGLGGEHRETAPAAGHRGRGHHCCGHSGEQHPHHTP